MWMITLLIVAASLTGAVESRMLPCDSFLRIVRPGLFTHCSSCFLGPWSSWTRTGKSLVNPNCTSLRSFRSMRIRKGDGDNCTETENKSVCEPTFQEQAKLFIEALNLGSPTSTNVVSIASTIQLQGNTNGPTSGKRLSAICKSPGKEICTKTNHRSSRATLEHTNNEILELNENEVSEPFDIERHLTEIKKFHNHRNKRQEENKRYVLLILDTSGSIGEKHFNLMLKTLSKLLPLFCGATKFAVMTFGDEIQRDICFQCYRSSHNTFLEALKSISYRHGPSTRSGDAIRCACNKMLTRTCGYHNEENAIIDVLFFTDGQSNSGEDVCTATKCLDQDRFDGKVNVVSIGIGHNINLDELECIKGNNGATTHIFDVRNLTGLIYLQKEVESELIEKAKTCKNCC